MRILASSLVAAALLSLAAVAPAAEVTTPPRPGIVAEVESSGGLIPFHSNLRLHGDGSVVFTERRGWGDEAEQSSRVIATLPVETVRQIAAHGAGLVSGELIDDSAGEPECLDAPTFTYYLRNDRGERIAIGARRNCHDLRHPGEGLYTVRRTLEILDELARSW
jgi:hypothetical protein